MEYRIVVEQQALRDVDEIVAYIATDSPAAAFDWYENLYGHFVSLGNMPRRCAEAPEPELASHGIRQMLFGRYRVLFTINDDRRCIHIHPVRHGARRAASADDVRRDEES